MRRRLSRVPWEVEAVLALIVLDGIAVIATYSRFPTSELYHVQHSDTVAGGFGRELVGVPTWETIRAAPPSSKRRESGRQGCRRSQGRYANRSILL